ncbi:MAG: pitrilysin family protein [Acidobacteriota bacterium]
MKNRLLGMLTLALAFLLTGVGGAKDFKIPYEKYVLSNGLTVILHVDTSNPIATVYTVYHVGSARETPGRTGFAHLFEHLRFNESQDIPQGMWFKKLQTAGATNVNGSTNTDRTNYYEVVPKNALEMALWMESDRMGWLLPKFTPQTFVTQQNVVQNEKRQGENAAYSQTSFINDKLMFPATHPYNWQVIGSLDDLASATIQDAVDFHNKYYGPSNATLVVAGDIDVVRTKKLIDTYFGEITSLPKPAALPKQRVTLAQTVRASYEDRLANAPQLTMTFPTVEEYSADSYALQFLGRLLAGSKKSPLYRVIVEEKKLAPASAGGGGGRGGFGGGGSVSANQRSRELAGALQISVRPFPQVKLNDVESAIMEGFARFEKDGVSAQDVERQKAGLEYRYYQQMGSIFGKATTLGNFNAMVGDPDYTATDLQNTMKVTKDDVLRVYNTYIRNRPFVLLSTVPGGKLDQAAPNSTPFIVPEESVDKQGTKKNVGGYNPPPIPSKIDRTKEPAKGPDPAVPAPAVWTAKTANGIPMYGITKSALPIAEFAITIKGGMLLDPAGKTGTGSLMARVMNEGTRKRTSVELRDAIDDLGASVNISGSDEAITVSGNCLSSKLPAVVALAREMMFEPRWAEQDFEAAKAQAIDSVKRSEANLAVIGASVFDKLIYGSDNILASPAGGTAKSLPTITLDDLKAYYAANFSSSVAAITVVGDVPKEAALKLFDGLKDWKATPVTMPDVKIANAAKPGVYFVDAPRAKQSTFVVGHVSLAATDPDYFKTIVMNHKLGGDFGSVFNMILREQKSFTYGARSGFSGSAYPGAFRMTTQVQANATFETATIVKDEIAKYRTGISAEDLQNVKNTLLKANAGRFETLPQLNAMLMPIVQYGLPFDYVRQRENVVRAMTLGEHAALAQKYLHADQLVFVIVGDKETQFDKLKELGLGDPVLLDKDGKPVAK